MVDDLKDWRLVKKDKHRVQRNQGRTNLKIGSDNRRITTSLNKGKSTVMGSNNCFDYLFYLQASEDYGNHKFDLPRPTLPYVESLGKQQKESRGKDNAILNMGHLNGLDKYVKFLSGNQETNPTRKSRAESNLTGGILRTATKEDHMVVVGNQKQNQTQTCIISNPNLMGLASINPDPDLNNLNRYQDLLFLILLAQILMRMIRLGSRMMTLFLW